MQMQIERINKPGKSGLYIFEALDNIAKLHHFQYKPDDESEELTTIKEQVCSSHHAAYMQMLDWFKCEKSQGFLGYNLKCKPVRVRDYLCDNWLADV
jgi:hypothetical protein